MASMAGKAARRKAIFNAAVISAMTLSAPGPLAAQAVEEHPAPIVTGPQTAAIDTSALSARPGDPTPFGVNLAGITVVDAHTRGNGALGAKSPGINTSLGGSIAQLGGFKAVLAKYMGQPLSYKLISQIEADITSFYRDNGRSLVNVTVPPQEITSGVLQVNVNTFVLETTDIQGGPPQNTGFLNRQIRLKPGQEVDTDRLLEDVNWLNLNPFRHVSVVFEPGATPDSTKLTLQVTNGRPWSGYAGASNSGTEATGRFRVFGGVNMSALPWQDHQLSYQFTAAPENLGRFALWNTGDEKGYVSHALTYFIPITFQNGFRTKLTFGASHISSFSVVPSGIPGFDFLTSTETNVGNVELSFPLRKTSGKLSLLPEIYLQGEYNDYGKEEAFGPLSLVPEASKVWHVVLGFRAGTNTEIFGKKARGSFDIGMVYGGLDTSLTAADLPNFTYWKLSARQEVFFDKDRSLELRVTGQKTDDELHSLEQMAVGGDGTVRGYPVNGVSGNTVLTGSVQYNFAPWSFKIGSRDGQFRPHVFYDAGFADQPAGAGEVSLASVGLGGEFGIGEDLVGSIDIANPLNTVSGVADSGDILIGVQVTARF